MEREDVDFLAEHVNDINCMGEHWPVIEQSSKSRARNKYNRKQGLEP